MASLAWEDKMSPVSVFHKEIVQRRTNWQDVYTQQPWKEMILEGGFFCVNGSHPDSWQQLDNMWKARSDKTSLLCSPSSFNFKTKGLQSVNGCVCVSVCVFLSFQVVCADIKSMKLPLITMVTISVNQKKIKKNLSLGHKTTVWCMIGRKPGIDLWW